ncbi:MAG: alpha-N-acetylglucosaminidase, partial [Sphingobacteriales bacterium]
VKRERELGMTPVLPAFAGHVPAIIKIKFPKAKVKSLGPWGGFSEKYHANFLNPFDPLFADIQRRFLTEQTKAFGTDHVYGIDPFNEVEPPSWEPAYLAKASKAIYTSVRKVDKQADWLQMSWMFYIDRKKWTDERIKAFVAAVPKDKMTMLDYYCEDTEVWKFTNSHYGQPFIWCYLGNFGGNTMLAGNLAEVESRMENALQHAGINLQGIGSTLEGFDVNPVMYDYVFEKAWSDGPVAIPAWIDHWAEMRGGVADANVKSAWQLLAEKVYNSPAKLGQATLTNAKPYLAGEPHWTTQPATGYRNKDLLRIWELLLKAKDKQNGLWQYDLTNVGRQVLGNHFANLYEHFQRCYAQRDISEMQSTADRMLSLLTDVDDLLAGHPSFSLDKWISEARALGTNTTEKNFYERNARTLITTWGGEQRSLNDYANRSWNGLTKSFYRTRWSLFFKTVIEAAQKGSAVDETLLRKKINAFEDDWTARAGLKHDEESKAAEPAQINQQLFDKYKQSILSDE